MRGRMQFAEAQLFGRTGKRCLPVLSDFAECKKYKLCAKDVFFLRMFRDLLLANVPREVCALKPENVVVFTDACYERANKEWPCGLGGVIFAGSSVFYFSLPVDAKLRQLLGELSKKQIIFEVETLAAVLSAFLWQDLFLHKRIILFVDNEGTKFSMLKGMSDNPCVDRVVELFASLESKLHSSAWIARVPSKCNVADMPSRGDRNTPLLVGAVDVSVKAQILLEELATQLFEKG